VIHVLDILLIAQRSDGDLGISNDAGHFFQTTSGTYIGGQPVGLGPSGLVFGTDLADNSLKMFAIFVSSSLLDTRVGSPDATETDLTAALPSVCVPGNKVSVYQGEIQNDTTAPYEDITWALGNDVYISSGGLWTNASGSGRTQSWGKVTVAPATYGDALEFQFAQIGAASSG